MKGIEKIKQIAEQHGLKVIEQEGAIIIENEAKPKYKKGDVVRLRTDLVVGERYGERCNFAETMKDLVGHDLVIHEYNSDKGCYVVACDYVYISEEMIQGLSKDMIFCNSISEEFWDKDEVVYWFSKRTLLKHKLKLVNISHKNYCDNIYDSEIYKTPESRDRALKEYKKSLEPKYRPFKVDEVTNDIACRLIKNKKTGNIVLLAGIWVNEERLNKLYGNYVFVDTGEPVGIKIN